MFAGRTQLFSLAAVWLWISLDIRCITCGSTSTPTMLETFHGHVLKRRIRSVIFPNKASLLFTPAFTKAILDGIPRGLSYSVEFDMYNSLPDTLEGWQPTILVNKIKKEKDLEQYRQLKEALKVTSTTDKMEIAQNYSEAFLEHSKVHESFDLRNPDLYQFPFHDVENSYDPWTYSHSKIDVDPNFFVRRKHYPHNMRSSNTYTPSQRFHKIPFRSKYAQIDTKREGNSYYNAAPSINQQTTNKLPHWRRYQNYRERRHIFDQLETVGKLININMKSCIQRAMCEMTMHLKPFGNSLMADVIRILLPVPDTRDSSSRHMKDDYSHRYVNVNCAHRFSVSCPYKVMQFLTQDLKIKMD